MKKIAFVGQMHYFKCSIPRQMLGYKIFEINVNFEPSDPSRFFPCLELQETEDIDYWIFFRGEYVPEQVLEQLQGKKINISTEPIGREDIRKMYFGENQYFFLEHFKHFDYFTHYDETEVSEIRNAGFKVDCAFPLPVDTDTYKILNLEKKWDIVFLGRSCFRRSSLTGSMKKDFEFLHVDNGMYDKEAVRAYNMSKVGLNLNVGSFKQFQHRVMNMMACGLPIISDVMSHTNWISEDEAKYFEFVKEPDGSKLYYLLQDMLEDESLPLKKRGEVMRNIILKKFDAKKNWVELIRKLEGEK